MWPIATICVFAKPPRAGEVKTRLAAALGPAGAARLAQAMFEDTWALARRLTWARLVLATTEPAAAEWHGVDAEIWPQGEGDLGTRLERVLRRALAESEMAIAIGADSPGLTVQCFEQARDRLHSAGAVVGPCDDGGFYLLGLRRCPPGLLRDIAWSSAETLACTRRRLQQHGLSTEQLERWFDVDEPSDLTRLCAALQAGDIVAPATAQMLQTFALQDRRQQPI